MNNKTTSATTNQVTLERCIQEASDGAGKQNILFLPDCLNNLIEEAKQRHQDAYQIRRGEWVEGYGKLNKPEIIWQMMIEGLAAIEEKLASIEKDPNALHNRTK